MEKYAWESVGHTCMKVHKSVFLFFLYKTVTLASVDTHTHTEAHKRAHSHFSKAA